MAIRVSSGLLFPRGRGLLLPLRLTSLSAISAIWRANASRSAWNSSGTPSFQDHGLSGSQDPSVCSLCLCMASSCAAAVFLAAFSPGIVRFFLK